MKTISIEMPYVAECSVTECAYNVSQNCHARAITVGNGVNPGCDTYFGNSVHSREQNRIAGVGACKVTGCQHNRDLECFADHIRVKHVGQQVNCVTFTPR